MRDTAGGVAPPPQSEQPQSPPQAIRVPSKDSVRLVVVYFSRAMKNPCAHIETPELAVLRIVFMRNHAFENVMLH